ncbi:MAG: quinone-dependent dihydroorotate dehydrogenase [Propionibacteriaceae bacterium]|nr:quinone-dependent dihydroorotate dehydrogenase [Propionibacteriaceae bacterium]
MNRRVAFVAFGYSKLLRPVLFSRDPEQIHELTIKALARVGSLAPIRALLKLLIETQGCATTVAGIKFPNRIGLAAGLDKDGLATRAWNSLGFGFAELGTVTALAQPGNEKPRIFRAVSSTALINRMGFNNAGAAQLAKTLQRYGIARGNLKAGIPLGVSIGKSKIVAVADAIEDYLTSFSILAEYADYFAINVSSPNTPQLRSLQDGEHFAPLLRALTQQSRQLAEREGVSPVPIFIKIAPDLSWSQLDDVISNATEHGADGIIATNTTLERTGLVANDERLREQAGGLSGAPLTARAVEIVRYIAEHTQLPVIGCGGIMSLDDAKSMFDAGAELIQLYTGFIFKGPALTMQLNSADRSRM